MSIRTISSALAALALGACSAAPADGPRASFDPDHLVEVEVELAASDWATLRAQTRSWVSVYDACLAAPFGTPFTWFDAAVTIDGVSGEASVRKRGFLGSLDEVRPSLAIRLAGGGEVLLNNAKQDASLVRQCLSYARFDAAGLPAPRCNFARVRVNGEELGVYVHVEKVDRELLARHFGRDDGALYEGTFSDFRAGWTATFELEQGPDERRALAAVVDALERPDGELEAALAEVVDVEQLLRFWAVEELVGHRDGFAGNANNYFAYHDPGSGRFHLIPWGADQAFVPEPEPVVPASMAPWRLTRITASRDRYVAVRAALLDEIWDEAALLAEIDRMEALLAPFAEPALDDVRAFVRGRRAAVAAPPAEGPLDEAPCLEDIGELRGHLSTRFGTSLGEAFSDGDGGLAVTVDGLAVEVGDVGASADWDPDDPGLARLHVLGDRADGTLEMLVLQADAARLHPGASLPIDWIAVVGLVYQLTPATGGLSLVGIIPEGTLAFTEVSTADGAVVEAAFAGRLVKHPFNQP